MGRNAKSPFEDLDQEFKDLVGSYSDEEVRSKVSQVALDEHKNLEAKKADVDLAEQKEKYREAGAQYREATKMNKLRIKYCHNVLEARGKV